MPNMMQMAMALLLTKSYKLAESYKNCGCGMNEPMLNVL